MRSFNTLTTEDVLQAHLALVQEFSTGDDPITPSGVKSQHLLESAVARQHTSIQGINKYKTLPQLSASLFYGLVLNHPFHNGNKRTALLSLVWLMDRNGHVLKSGENELFDFVVSVAEHRFRPAETTSASDANDEEVREIGSWIGKNVRQVNRQIKPMSWREFRRKLIAVGCTVGSSDRNFVDIQRGARRVHVAFPGDHREASRDTIKHVWRTLELSEVDAFDAASFLGKSAPVSAFVVQYRSLLQRLARA